MINFASLFGNFNRGGNSAISELLEKPDASIENLLDIETFPNEYKSGNNKVLEYLKYNKYEELIKYVTVQGPADDQKKGYKFPMIATDILSSENTAFIDLTIPEGDLEIDIQYDSIEEFEVQIDDNSDEQYLTEEQPENRQQQPIQLESNTPKQSQQQTESTRINTQQQSKGEDTVKIEVQEKLKKKNEEEEEKSAKQQGQSPKKAQVDQQTIETEGETQKKQQDVVKQSPKKVKKTKIIKNSRIVKKTKKQRKEPLLCNLMEYFKGPINYTLAGYVCKILTTLLTKKTTLFYKYLFKADKDYINILCNHIQSKSVGDLIFKILTVQSTEYLTQRSAFYDTLIGLLAKVEESHVISNLAYTIHEIIEKSATYIKTKPNIINNTEIVDAFLNIFYRPQLIHKIVTQTLSDSDVRSGYSCMVLHSYLHYTEIETFNSFKLETVLELFIKKAVERLRNTPHKRTLGMGRVKIVEIFCFLVKKQKNIIDSDEPENNEVSSELLEQLYIHQLIAKETDFFNILLQLVQSFQNNNILHNEVFKIIESVILQKPQNKSALQSLLLNDECILLKFFIDEAFNDAERKKSGKFSSRKGYIGHTINACKLIIKTENNEVLDQIIKHKPQFNYIVSTLIAADITQTNKNLAGYQMKKNAAHQIMFQREDIITAYTDFLSNCPKPEYETERQTSEDQSSNVVTDSAEQMMMSEERDEEKYNQVVAMAEQINESNPKYWQNHMKYDLDSLINDIE